MRDRSQFPLIGIDPEADVERTSTDNFIALPASLEFERLVHFNVATIGRADYGDCKGALPKGFRKLLFRFSKLDLCLPSPRALPEQAKDEQGW